MTVRLLGFLPTSHYLLLSLLFFAGLEMAVQWHQWLPALLTAMAILLAYGILLVRMEERRWFSLSQLFLPILTVTGLTGLTVFLPKTPLLHLYFGAAALLFFWVLKHAAKQAYPTWNWTLSTVVFFLNVAVILGFRYVMFAPLVYVVSGVFAVSFLISYQGWRRLADSAAPAVLLSLALALALSQIVWVLNFLPAHFLVQAGVATSFYYAMFNLLCVSQERRVCRADLAEYGLIGAVGLLILIVSANWI